MNDDANEVSTMDPALGEPMAMEDPTPMMGDMGAHGYGHLVVKRNGVETDISFPINPPAIIGRFDPAVGPIDVDLSSLPEGSYVSRKHAKITLEDGAWMIHDLGSSNGTFVLNDDFDRVEIGALSDGQEIALGNARFVFHLREEQ